MVNEPTVVDSALADQATHRLEGDGQKLGSVGPYVLLQRLGTGGVGDVFEALQEEPVRRRVAVKVLEPDMDSRGILSPARSRQAADRQGDPGGGRELVQQAPGIFSRTLGEEHPETAATRRELGSVDGSVEGG